VGKLHAVDHVNGKPDKIAFQIKELYLLVFKQVIWIQVASKHFFV
jgi:hypothetical protein